MSSMASYKYDEDVYDNPFFSGVSASYPNVLEKIVKYHGLLCVPKLVVSSRYRLTKSDAMDHVFLPRIKEGEENVEDFITASGKEAHIRDGKISTGKGFDVAMEVTILFTETFHTDAGGSYKVLCLDGYLNKEKEPESASSSTTIKISAPTSYQQCLDLLWSHSGGQKTRDALDRVLKTYAHVYERLEGENLRSIVDAASAHFAKAMQLLLKDSVVRKSTRHNTNYMESLKLAVETYMMNSLHKRLFRAITAAMASDDSEINKITRNLVDLRLTDLGIRKVFIQNIPPAKKELSVLNQYSTPMGRLFCIKRIMSVLTKPPRTTTDADGKEEGPVLMTSDDLLPILIFLIIKSEIPNWYANLVYMRHFHFAKSSDDDEFGFYLATVEAALEHIKTGNMRDEIQPLTNKRNRWNSLTFSDTGDLSPPTSIQGPHEPSVIEEFFTNVQQGREKAVQAMLEKPHKATEEIQLMLCHPLCSCDRCGKIMSVFRTKSDLATAYTRDNRGYTALHMAAYCGQGILIDLLVKNNAVVDATDYLGLTPLHLACQRGYQNVMLLLLHFTADVTASDNEGNTPLHLACANGHEDCVKALVFYDGSVKKLQVNAVNEMKDTPLHLAAKWGFEGIVKVLLENGANAIMYNRKGQTPVSLAQNVIVQRLLQLAADGYYPDFPGHLTSSSSDSPSKSHSKYSVLTPSASTSSSSKRKGSLWNSFNRSNSVGGPSSTRWVETASLEVESDTERRKRKEKLFKAIMEGDIQLVKFYLGVATTSPGGEEDMDDVEEGLPVVNSTASDMCHPLCQCVKCLTIQRTNKVLGEKVGVNIRTATGSSPLHTAVLHNHSDIVELLISLHADTSAQNHKSLTPLHLACCMRNSLITDMLVKAGAKLNVQDMNGDTPLLIASSNGFINGVYTLIKAGASINVINKAGNSALHEAAKRNLTDTMGLLVKSGVDVTVANNEGKLASEYIQRNKDEAVDSTAASSPPASQPQQAPSAPPASSSSSLNPKKDPGEIHHISIKDLFAAFEESDLHTLRALTASIRSFDKEGSLKRASTRDGSCSVLSGIAHSHSITSFNAGTLRKVKAKLRDKTDPLYIYSLSSLDFDDGDVSIPVSGDIGGRGDISTVSEDEDVCKSLSEGDELKDESFSTGDNRPSTNIESRSEGDECNGDESFSANGNVEESFSANGNVEFEGCDCDQDDDSNPKFQNGVCMEGDGQTDKSNNSDVDVSSVAIAVVECSLKESGSENTERQSVPDSVQEVTCADCNDIVASSCEEDSGVVNGINQAVPPSSS